MQEEEIKKYIISQYEDVGLSKQTQEIEKF